MKHEFENNYKNVRIRQIQITDIELLRTWRNNPVNTKFLSKIPYITFEQQLNWYNSYLKDKETIIFAIEEIDSIKAVVGSMSLYKFSDNSAEFGRFLIGDDRAHGKKVGLNAIQALKKVAFEILQLDSLTLIVANDNYSALKVYEYAGFKIYEQTIIDSIINYKMVIKK